MAFMPASAPTATPTLVNYGVPITGGESIMPRYWAINGASLATGNLALQYWYPSVSQTINFISTKTQATAGGTMTYANLGIYSVGATTLTLLGSTGDIHTSTWTSTFTSYKSALTSGVAVSTGTQYCFGALVVATTGPALAGGFLTGYCNNSPTLLAVLTSQSTLPASVTISSTVANPNGDQAILALMTNT
jgi:hypothetical protein